LRLLKGQDRAFQLSEGMGASSSRSHSAWKSQFANVFRAWSVQEKLQGEAQQTCLTENKKSSEWVFPDGALGGARRQGKERNWRREQIS